MIFDVITDTNQLYSLIKSKAKPVVILDIFDTIIHRKIYPEDIKKISCAKLIELLNLKEIDVNTLYLIRAEIEINLCKENQIKGFDLEFDFTDFAKLLFSELQSKSELSHTQSEFINMAEQAEISAELCCQYIDESIKQTIMKLKEDGITVICCSDFYLNKNILFELLQFYGIGQYIDEIIVSSEYFLTKRSGRLYNVVSKKYGAENCLMIGDNEESDCKQALANGIASIHINRAFFHNFYSESRDLFANEMFYEKLTRFFNYSNEILFPELALSVFYFIKNLHSSLLQKKYNDVFFLAREGQLLQELFNIYQYNCIINPSLIIKTHYLKVSRRSTFIPGLSKIYNEKFHTLFRQYIHISCLEFLNSLGFDQSFTDYITGKIGVDKQKKEKDFPKSETYVKLVTNDEFIAAYEARRLEQHANFIQYLKSFSPKRSDKIALVDIGWKGTIQDNFKKIDESISIEGFYLGLVVPVDNNDAKNLKHGLLFSKNDNEAYASVFDENRSLYEVVFAANHGSAMEYIKNAQGHICVKEEDFSEEITFYKKNIFPVINTHKKIFELICQEYNKHAIDDKSLYNAAAKHHARIVFHPAENEVNWFLNLYHVENFGVFQKNIFNYETRKKKWIQKIETYIDYKKNPGQYTQNVIWPSAELIKHGLKKRQLKYAKMKHKSIFGV